MNENYSLTTDSTETSVAVEASKEVAMEGDFDKKWQDGRTPPRQCSAHRTNGDPCRRAAINGGNVCATHGGRSPQVKAKARVRLEMAADRMAKELLGIATNSDAPPAVKLAAIRDALDRAGLSAKTAVDINVGPTPAFESILADMVSGGSRAESRARRGVQDEASDPQNDWIAEELHIINAEVIEDNEPTPPPPAPAQPTPTPQPESGSGLMDYETALDQLRASAPPPAPQAQRRTRR